MALQAWLTSSLFRHFPLATPQRVGALTIEAALNEQFS